MMKKNILLIAEDPKTVAAVKEALGRNYHLETARGLKTVQEQIGKKPPALIVIDFDLKGEDGLQVFKQLGTSIRVVMLSASGNIPLAVSATKLGVAEFLRKPLDIEQFRSVVERNIAGQEIQLCWPAQLEWLSGKSLALAMMIDQIKRALAEDKHIVLLAEPGINKQQVAELIHGSSGHSDRKLVPVDAASFRREDLESHFWATLQEIMAIPDQSSLKQQTERCGTIYLGNMERLEPLFQQTILKFFKEKQGKIDRSIRLIVGIESKAWLQQAKVKDYALVEVPPLRQRKTDLAHLLKLYLRQANLKHGKDVRFVSSDLLALLTGYDFPGNYLELARQIEEAVLAADSDKLGLKEFPLKAADLVQNVKEESLRSNLNLTEARRNFEKELYYVLLNKTAGESGRVARFLDVPKTALAERIEDLLD